MPTPAEPKKQRIGITVRGPISKRCTASWTRSCERDASLPLPLAFLETNFHPLKINSGASNSPTTLDGGFCHLRLQVAVRRSRNDPTGALGVP
jgi:hypothetical protein